MRGTPRCGSTQPPSKATSLSPLTLSCLPPSPTRLGLSSPVPQLLQDAFLARHSRDLGREKDPGEVRQVRSQAGEECRQS